MDTLINIGLGAALIVALMIVAIIMFCIFNNPIAPPNEKELDRTQCQQMRDSGWKEEDIEDYMDCAGGNYHPPED